MEGTTVGQQSLHSKLGEARIRARACMERAERIFKHLRGSVPSQLAGGEQDKREPREYSVSGELNDIMKYLEATDDNLARIEADIRPADEQAAGDTKREVRDRY